MKEVLVMNKVKLRNKMRIGEIEFDVVVLDNGERVITEESLQKFIDAMKLGNNKEVKKLMKDIRIHYVD
jgi:hypothetical protein